MVDTVPHDVPLQPLPATLQLTPVFEEPLTEAENCRLPPTTTTALVGEMLIETGPEIVTVALPDLDGAATEVAVTVIRFGFGALPGATYSPLDEIVPQAAPVQPLPTMLQVTAVFVVPRTVAANCCLPPMINCAAAGATVTEMGTVIVTDAVLDFVESATEVAVTDIWGGLGAAAGAV